MSRELILVPKKRYDDLLKQKDLIVSEQEHTLNNDNSNDKNDTNSETNHTDNDESEREKEQIGEGINKKISAVEMSFDTFDKLHKGKIKKSRQYGAGNDVRRKWLSFKF